MLKFISMNDERILIINVIKENLRKKKEKTKGIPKLINKNIDRKFHLELNELTPTELDFEMNKRAANIRENIDPRVYLNSKKTKNKFVKIMLIFPFLFRLIFIKPVTIFRDLIFFFNALIIRLRNTDLRLKEIEQKLNSISDSNDSLSIFEPRGDEK